MTPKTTLQAVPPATTHPILKAETKHTARTIERLVRVEDYGKCVSEKFGGGEGGKGAGIFFYILSC